MAILPEVTIQAALGDDHRLTVDNYSRAELQEFWRRAADRFVNDS